MKEETKKHCPLKFSNPNRFDWGIECDKEKCMWWDECSGQCLAVYEGYLASFNQTIKESRE